MEPFRLPLGTSEPPVTDWRATTAQDVLDRLDLPNDRPAVLAIDGRGGAGKSTLGRQLADVKAGASLVSTDDIAWNHSFFDWSDLLIDNVIRPVRTGAAVAYRPPGWISHHRPGAVEVPANRSLLIIEGVGCSQAAMRDHVDATVWVQSDEPTAYTQAIERDVASGVNGDRSESIAFWDEWMADELPFLDRETPWAYADVVVAGVRPGSLSGLLWSPTEARADG